MSASASLKLTSHPSLPLHQYHRSVNKIQPLYLLYSPLRFNFSILYLFILIIPLSIIFKGLVDEFSLVTRIPRPSRLYCLQKSKYSSLNLNRSSSPSISTACSINGDNPVSSPPNYEELIALSRLFCCCCCSVGVR